MPGTRSICDCDWAALSDLTLQKRDNTASRSPNVAEANGFHSHRTTIRTDDEFRNSLRSAHDTGGVDCLVRRNQDQIIRSECNCSIYNLLRAQYVGLCSGKRVLFHQWDMLAGRSMQNNMRTIALKNILEQRRIADVTHDLFVPDSTIAVNVQSEFVQPGFGNIQ